MKHAVIIVAGGTGNRMQQELPKQFLLLCNKPVLMHTILAFSNTFSCDIIVVLHPDYHDYWNKLCRDYSFNVAHKIVKGGSTRFKSVKNGLKAVENADFIAVHDAARPLISSSTIINLFNDAEKKGNAIASIPSKDSVRFQENEKNSILNRDKVFLIQTPQVFKTDILKDAYKQTDNNFTDDASVVENAGYDVYLSEGDHANIKITYPEDLIFAEAYLKNLK